MTPNELAQHLALVNAVSTIGANHVSLSGQKVLQGTGCFRHSAFTMAMIFIDAVGIMPKGVQDLMMASLNKPLPPTAFPEAIEQHAAVRDLIATAIRLHPMFHPASPEVNERLDQHIEHMAHINSSEQN